MRRYSTFHSRKGDGVQFNMTPLIDVTFQLIIFFILASQMASSSLAKLELARPYRSQARDMEQDDQVKLPKIIINVVLDEQAQATGDPMFAGQARVYKVNAMDVEVGDSQRLTELIAAAVERSGVSREDFHVEVRADKRVNGSDVIPVLQAAARAGVPRVNLSALTDVSE